MGHEASELRERTDCDPVVWSDSASPGWEAGWEQLKLSGWHSRADDGMEAIYPPGCEGIDQ